MNVALAPDHRDFAPLEFARIGDESALRGLFDTLFEESDTGLAILGLEPDGTRLKILDGNARLLDWLGHPRPSIVGTDFLDCLTPESRSENLADLRRAAIGWRGGSFRLTLNAAAPLPCALSLRPIRDDGLRCRLLAILRAESDEPGPRLTLAERERDAALQTRNCLLAHLSHDLRTPLNAILGFAEMLQQMDDVNNSATRDYASHIAVSGRDLLRRIEDLLTTAGMMPPLAPETGAEADLKRLITRLEPVAMREAARLGVSLEVSLEDNPPPLHARPGDLQRLLEATLDCSLRGTPRGGHIRLCLQRHADRSLVLSIEDSGPPVSERALSALYDSAFSDGDLYACRGERSSAGLVTARFLAESNGGSLTLADEGADGGYGCYIRFPVERLAPW